MGLRLYIVNVHDDITTDASDNIPVNTAKSETLKY